MEIQNSNTLAACLSTGINLFVGAGFSVLAKDSLGRTLPLGDSLRNEIIAEFKLQSVAHLDLPKISTILEATRRDEFRRFLLKRFTVGSFDERYTVLNKFEINSIFTTNIDDLMFKVYGSSLTHYLNHIYQCGPALKDRQAIDYVTLHGCVTTPERPMTFSSRDLAAAFGADSDRWHFLTGKMQRLPTLFWGYSMADAGVLEALAPSTIAEREKKDTWVVLHPSANDSGNKEYFKALGFQIIVADTEEMLGWLKGVIPATADNKPSGAAQPTKLLFPQEALPDPGTLPVRPIIEFFLGDTPWWTDIFSGKIHKTEHFHTIINSINSKRNTVFVGNPACGKTTLLMQIAQGITFEGHKLITDSLTKEKASLFQRKLGNSRALILIDNYTDSIDAFVSLSQCPTITLVGCDRTYNHEITSHKIDKDLFNIFDITELNQADIQAILDGIPKDVRVDGPIKNPNDAPSVFELVEQNVTAPTLKKRYFDVLTDLAAHDTKLLEFLLACCYVHRCRTPISMDMLFAYFRDSISDYQEILAMRQSLGKMLKDSSLANDDLQDYFVAKSVYLAETVLDLAKAADLRKMLLRFQKNVSPYRIHRFDDFKKRAYDHSLLKRAFSDFNEGIQYYTVAYKRDLSPYLLQQGALYLADKRQFQQAFNWIDDAIVKSGGKIPSIRNSHAIILFDANIERDESDGTVKRTLHLSMEILKDCHQYDKRKTYHATTFARQAIAYWNKYLDAEGKQYLTTAKAWLQGELQTSPWHRYVKQLLREISRIV